jgi:hypothetical protein
MQVNEMDDAFGVYNRLRLQAAIRRRKGLNGCVQTGVEKG